MPQPSGHVALIAIKNGSTHPLSTVCPKNRTTASRRVRECAIIKSPRKFAPTGRENKNERE
eukprot:CAMPEP_0204148566 /NCGR_PEP_ID=MMETSP0361-20130328/23652_1 /ASSEMBLY_ACC=CAM_ASM_000343 /TAXON_ID=268821 /ORGANISM="Scrippsiella Hangoei, Strain SHTV-5" /LENGTH=60 /DNA_ID=CAMNT_0051102929 /DNA_START=33 /DNA_END=212 /DNA_ORIENTATION=-